MTGSNEATLSTLGAHERDLIRLTLAIQLGLWSELRALRDEQPADTPPTTWRAWREAILQLHLFAGIPRIVEAFGRLADAGGLGEIDDDEASGPDRFEAGRELFGRIYADGAPTVRDHLERFHPALASWIEGHAYGRVLARPGLDVARRELLAVAALIVLDQPRQLAAHVRGARRVGVSADVLGELLELVANDITPEAIARARDVVAEYA